MIIVKSDGTPLSVVRTHLEDSELQKFNLRKQGRRKLASMPVCPKCEQAGLRTRGWKQFRTMQCTNPKCSYIGTATHVVSAYINEQLYK